MLSLQNSHKAFHSHKADVDLAISNKLLSIYSSKIVTMAHKINLYYWVIDIVEIKQQFIVLCQSHAGCTTHWLFLSVCFIVLLWIIPLVFVKPYGLPCDGRLLYKICLAVIYLVYILQRLCIIYNCYQGVMTQHFYLSITPSVSYIYIQIPHLINMYSKEMDLQLILQALTQWFWVTQRPGVTECLTQGNLAVNWFFSSLTLSRLASNFSPYWPMVVSLLFLPLIIISHTLTLCVIILLYPSFPYRVQHSCIMFLCTVNLQMSGSSSQSGVVFSSSLFAFPSRPLHFSPISPPLLPLIDFPCFPQSCSSLYIHWAIVFIISPFS